MRSLHSGAGDDKITTPFSLRSRLAVPPSADSKVLLIVFLLTLFLVSPGGAGSGWDIFFPVYFIYTTLAAILNQMFKFFGGNVLHF